MVQLNDRESSVHLHQDLLEASVVCFFELVDAGKVLVHQDSEWKIKSIKIKIN